jgi:DNA-binding transcriptional regulator PaaX
MGRALREMERELDSCHHDFSGHSQETVSATLSKLKRRGMVKTKGPKKKTIWFITKHGRAHFRTTNMGEDLPPKDGKIRLVLYDIPEEKASYRVWLRHRLFVCDYTFLQKSVWLGTRPLPKELLKGLKERGLTSYVHVVGLEKFLDGAADD